MSDNYQQFRAVLANLKATLKAVDSGVYVPDEKTSLLNNKGVILVSQKDVRSIDFAVKQLRIAGDSIASAMAALSHISDVSKVEMQGAAVTVADYEALLIDIVQKAYDRRMQAVKAAA